MTLGRSRASSTARFDWFIGLFYGTSINAVKMQISIAITTYLLVAILKKELDIKHDLYTILQVLSVSLFEKTPLLQVFQTLIV